MPKCPVCGKPMKPRMVSGKLDDALKGICDAVSTAGASLAPVWPEYEWICTNYMKNEDGLEEYKKKQMKISTMLAHTLGDVAGLDTREQPPPAKIPCKNHYKLKATGKYNAKIKKRIVGPYFKVNIMGEVYRAGGGLD